MNEIIISFLALEQLRERKGLTADQWGALSSPTRTRFAIEEALRVAGHPELIKNMPVPPSSEHVEPGVNPYQQYRTSIVDFYKTFNIRVKSSR